jgi:hypothetical protein
VTSTSETEPLAASIGVLVLVLLAVWLHAPERSGRAVLPGEEAERLREPDFELLYLLLSSILVAAALVSIAVIAFYSSTSEIPVGAVPSEKVARRSRPEAGFRSFKVRRVLAPPAEARLVPGEGEEEGSRE